MHADILGDILEHHRFDMLDAVVEKFALPRDDALDHAVDRLPAMLDISQQIDGRPHLVLDKILGFLRRLGLIQHPVICRADPQPRAAVVGKIDDVIVVELFDINLGRNKDRVLGRITPPRIRIELTDLFDLFVEHVNVNPGVL